MLDNALFFNGFCLILSKSAFYSTLLDCIFLQNKRHGENSNYSDLILDSFYRSRYCSENRMLSIFQYLMKYDQNMDIFAVLNANTITNGEELLLDDAITDTFKLSNVDTKHINMFKLKQLNLVFLSPINANIIYMVWDGHKLFEYDIKRNSMIQIYFPSSAFPDGSYENRLVQVCGYRQKRVIFQFINGSHFQDGRTFKFCAFLMYFDVKDFVFYPPISSKMESDGDYLWSYCPISYMHFWMDSGNIIVFAKYSANVECNSFFRFHPEIEEETRLLNIVIHHSSQWTLLFKLKISSNPEIINIKLPMDQKKDIIKHKKYGKKRRICANHYGRKCQSTVKTFVFYLFLH